MRYAEILGRILTSINDDGCLRRQHPMAGRLRLRGFADQLLQHARDFAGNVVGFHGTTTFGQRARLDDEAAVRERIERDEHRGESTAKILP